MSILKHNFEVIDRVGTRKKRYRLVQDPLNHKTDPSMAKECDINSIVARARRVGQLPESARAAAKTFGDFSQVPTYPEMFEKVQAAQRLFNQLPAKVRNTFKNDPGLFLASTATEEGQALLRKLGLGDQPSETPPGSGAASPSSPSEKEKKKSTKVVGEKPTK